MSEGQAAFNPDAALFTHLLASKPPREGKGAAEATAASVVLHALLVSGLVWATLAVGKEVAEEDKPAEDVTFIKIENKPPPPPPPPEQAPPPPKPKGFQTLAAPEVIPVDIPPPDTMATVEEDYSGIGEEGGVDEGVDETQTYLQGQVSVIPKMLTVVKPRYPESLKKMEIEGTVIIQAIIKPDGKVEASSVKVIKKLHPQLDDAAIEALVATPFSPALYGSRPVRVIMQIPYTFKFK